MNILSLDTETTGLTYDNDVVEFAFLYAKLGELDGKVTIEDDTELDLFLPSDMDSSPEALSKHGLTKDVLKYKAKHRNMHGAMVTISNMLMDAVTHDTVIVGMNLAFDLSMLFANFNRYGIGNDITDRIKQNLVCYDIWIADMMLRPNATESRNLHSLSQLYGAFTKPDHSAINDCKAAFEVCMRQTKFEAHPMEWWKQMHNEQQVKAIRMQLQLRKKYADTNIGWPWHDDAI